MAGEKLNIYNLNGRHYKDGDQIDFETPPDGYIADNGLASATYDLDPDTQIFTEHTGAGRGDWMAYVTPPTSVGVSSIDDYDVAARVRTVGLNQTVFAFNTFPLSLFIRLGITNAQMEMVQYFLNSNIPLDENDSTERVIFNLYANDEEINADVDESRVNGTMNYKVVDVSAGGAERYQDASWLFLFTNEGVLFDLIVREAPQVQVMAQ